MTEATTQNETPIPGGDIGQAAGLSVIATRLSADEFEQLMKFIERELFAAWRAGWQSGWQSAVDFSQPASNATSH